LFVTNTILFKFAGYSSAFASVHNHAVDEPSTTGTYARRESPAQRQAYHEHQIQRLYPGCTVTVTVTSPPGADGPDGATGPSPGHVPKAI